MKQNRCLFHQLRDVELLLFNVVKLLRPHEKGVSFRCADRE